MASKHTIICYTGVAYVPLDVCGYEGLSETSLVKYTDLTEVPQNIYKQNSSGNEFMPIK